MIDKNIYYIIYIQHEILEFKIQEALKQSPFKFILYFSLF